MICIIFFAGLLVFTVFLFIRSKGLCSGMDDQRTAAKGLHSCLLPVGSAFMDLIRYRYRTRYDLKLHRQFGELYGAKNADSGLRLHWAAKVCHVLLILLILSFFGSMMWVQETVSRGSAQETHLIGGRELVRPAFGGGSREVYLKADVKKGEQSRQQLYAISIPEAAPPSDSDAVIKALERLTGDMIKGSNRSLDAVSSRLQLNKTYKALENLEVHFEWRSSNTQVVAADGAVTVPEAHDMKAVVMLTATAKKGAVMKEKRFEVTVCKPTISEGRILSKVLEELGSSLKEISRGKSSGADDVIRDDRILLPTTSSYEGVIITWLPDMRPKEDSGLGTLFFAFFTAGLIAYLLDRGIHDKAEKRRRQIQYDFPDFLNKLVLLMGAGMTAGRAMDRIQGESGKDSPFYRELAAALSDIRGGKPEHQAYEAFAGRCKVPEVAKFVSVLLQNLRKGSEETVAILRLQSVECWEMRKNAAKRLGEEASTKLLLPLMLMLVAILMIVTAPAVLSMKGF